MDEDVNEISFEVGEIIGAFPRTMKFIVTQPERSVLRFDAISLEIIDFHWEIARRLSLPRPLGGGYIRTNDAGVVTVDRSSGDFGAVPMAILEEFREELSTRFNAAIVLDPDKDFSRIRWQPLLEQLNSENGL